ncbi:uncharacterized protein LACBIDRAFT_313178 [Laccaria bicolor S238N-H82]|uniref:Predicted protein n=1 Tax=Laccaria bicolor (strain S238N-H82 / ATCC MYA-4686) TaxID=486041 RepID=B0DXQ3_LACBS|nr:uncharacterized protein LACBIDRAFT_313178 [Laccaria bicolor S238N-H82]EDR00655.1 predicted protein [Laccaria bicolor S238N-H82]|eukprot:XP_001888664.1 predicted protein [Laccaria bicolor S238N-H82]
MAPTNTHGFCSLPAELYLEIASHYGSASVFSKQQTVYDGKPFERRATLLALSQTCVKLRGIFLPLAWQHLELREAQEFSSSLTRLLNVMTQYNPALSSYIKAVNVVVPKDPSTTTFKELAYFLRLLPNLLTIQLLNLQDKFATAFSEAFDYKKCILPRVRTLLIADTAIHLVACCPKVKNVTAVGPCKARFVRTLASTCQKTLFEKKGASVVEHSAQVTTISHYFCDGDLMTEEIKRFTALRHLCRLKITTAEAFDRTINSPQDAEDCLVLRHLDVNLV